MRTIASALAAAAIGSALCASAAASDASVEQALRRGVAEIRASHPAGKKLRGQLVRTIAKLRSERGSTAVGERGRKLAVEGFTSTLKGVKHQIAFIENDSGNIPAAERDARMADRYLNRGAKLLRAAGRALGVRIGKLNGR